MTNLFHTIPRRALCAIPSLLTLLCLETTANAHHVVSDAGIAWVEPLNVVQLEVESSRFDLEDGSSKGRWWSTSLMVEYALWPRLSVMARAPLVSVGFDDGRRATGLGDMDVSLKSLLWADDHGLFIASAGLGAEIPTGSVRDALGSGHVELSPYLTLSSNPKPWLLLNALLQHRSSLTGQGSQPDDDGIERSHQGSPLAVHAPHELLTRLNVTLLRASRRVYFTSGFDYIHVWNRARPAPGDALLLRGEVGYFSHPRRWRIAITAKTPALLPTTRARTSLSTNLAIFFP